MADRLDIVRRALAAWEAQWECPPGDLLPELLLLAAPDVLVHAPMSGQVTGKSTYRGHAGLREWIGGLQSAFDVWHLAAPQLELVGGDQVFVECQLRVRGRGSGVPFELPMYLVCDVIGGLVHALRIYFEATEARAAAGRVG
ncbi:MAG: hypothetical protein NVSMB51_08590 [Solirubrobacteraceae bacterium]